MQFAGRLPVAEFTMQEWVSMPPFMDGCLLPAKSGFYRSIAHKGQPLVFVFKRDACGVEAFAVRPVVVRDV